MTAPVWDVDVEVLTRGIVRVEAPTATQARVVAERGAAAWLGPLEAPESLAVTAISACRQENDHSSTTGR